MVSWTLLVPLALAHAWRARGGKPARFALVWLAVHTVLILASTTQRVRYLLSIYPGLTLVVAGWAADAGRPRRATVVKAMAAGMAAALLVGVWVYNVRVDATHDYRGLAARAERHAAGGPVGAFISKGEYLQLDFYLGRDLTLLTLPPEVAAFVARPERPLVIVNQEAWERHERAMPPGLVVLETARVGGETIRIVRLSR